MIIVAANNRGNASVSDSFGRIRETTQGNGRLLLFFPKNSFARDARILLCQYNIVSLVKAFVSLVLVASYFVPVLHYRSWN